MDKKNERKQRLIKRNQEIVKRFFEESSKQYKGTKIHTNEYIFVLLGNEFHLSALTVEDIIFGRVHYK